MGLIDKRTICEKLVDKALEEQLFDECAEETTKECLHIVRAMPTVDPIYYAGGCYCRECARCDGFPGPDIQPNEVGICKISMMVVEHNDFCSHGRRKEGADG